MASGAPALEEATAEREYLLDRALWLVRLRWVAVVGVNAAAFAGASTGFVPDPASLAAVSLALGLCNVAWWRVLRRPPAAFTPHRLRLFIFSQLVADMGALALLTHFSGGAENPFQMLFALSAAIGAILLTGRQAAVLGVVGVSFEVVVVVGQSLGWLDHHGLHDLEAREVGLSLYRQPRFVAGYLLAFVTMLAGVIYLARSVTERYQRAEALRREHDRVAQSRERLARIGELSAGVAHALRNPLHGLLNSVDLLRPRVEGDADAEETLALHAEALQRIAGITHRLLSLTRDAPVATAACDVDALVTQTIRLSPRPGTRARIETALAGVGEAELDADRFSEALSNLLDNALYACRDGGTVIVRTMVEAGAEPGPGAAVAERVAVEVEDSGEGIPDEVLSRVFDPFFTTKAVGEGTGLGLGIARRVAEEHGGQVSLWSQQGKGTRVRLAVPRRVPKSDGART